MKKAWITWESQPRNISMAKLLGASYYEFNYQGNILVRYIYCIYHTFCVFRKSYPVIFVQNPSIVLTIFSVLINTYFKKTLVVDAHNAGVFPKEGKSILLNKINLFILKNVHLVLVTNLALAKYLRSKNIDAFEFTDPLPTYPNGYYSDGRESKSSFVFVVCSWSEDEPIEVYLKACELMPNVKFKFSGNFNKYTNLPKNIPSNIELLGFVSKNEYIETLFDSTLVVDLTLRNDCLVCGAYEAISANKLVILTDNEVNREVFLESAIYTQIDADSLVEAVNEGFSYGNSSTGDFKEKYNRNLEKKKDELLINIKSSFN